MYFHSKKKRFSARRFALLFPLLVGLLFSGGEGITLLPFPDLETGSVPSNFQPPSPSRTGHIGFDSSDGVVQLKIQSRNHSQQIGGSGWVIFTGYADFSLRARIDCSSKYSDAGSGRLLESISGRAPPDSVSS